MTNEAGNPDATRQRGYRRAAADLAVRRRRKRADEFAAKVCEFAGLDHLDDGERQFAEESARAARVGLTRRA